MSGRSKRVVVALVGALLVLPVASGQGAGSTPAADVKAEGNPFSGGLAFNPSSVSVKVGQIVRWTNTDVFVPHTATEDHGLWDLAGTYGISAVAPLGFGPGESRQRVFEAGTQRYYCKVHPQQMRGVVAVPVTVAVKNGPVKNGTKTRRVVITWASGKPVAGEAFDVQLMRAGGKWTTLGDGTRDASATIATHGKKTAISARARLRLVKDRSRATGWSPVKTVQG